MTKKLKTATCIEMEVAISKYFGIRTHIIVPNLSWGFVNHECDLFIIRKSGVAFEVEIKRSKSDLLADFKKDHQHIDNKICQLYYAIPVELLEDCEQYIPEHCGIIVCEYSTYGKVLRARMHRDAKRNKNYKKLSLEEQLKVARLGCLRIWSLKEKNIKLLKNCA
jgi:hypothetical protein